MPFGAYRSGLLGSGFTLVVPDATPNANFYTLAVAAGYLGGPCRILILPGRFTYATTTANYAARTGTGWAAGVKPVITNLGYLDGCGGAGSTGSGFGAGGGGPAFLAEVPCIFDNNSGAIRGGGGGGGLGVNISGSVYPSGAGGGGGGGGQGRQGGAGGLGFDVSGAQGNPGGNGQLSGPGAGGTGAYQPTDASQAGTGGTGGTWGASGANGSDATDGVPDNEPYIHYGSNLTGAGGGNAVEGNSLITWIATGIRLGAIVP